MMEFVWLLNAAISSTVETSGLLSEFLSHRKRFYTLLDSTPNDSPQGRYLEAEVRRSIHGLTSIRDKIEGVVGVLESSFPDPIDGEAL